MTGRPAPRAGTVALLALVVALPTTLALGLAAGANLPGSCSPGSGLALATSQPNQTAPSTVTFAVTDPNGPPAWVNWSFGDGLSVNHTGSAYLAISHLYEAPGSFAASVVVGLGSSIATCSTTVTVVPAPFAVAIHAAPSRGSAPLTVVFTAVVRGGTGTYDSAIWSFGNGEGGTGFNVSYTYEAAGQYVATLTVLDSASQVAIANASITVGPGPNATGSGGSDGASLGWTVLLVVSVLAVGVAIGLLAVLRPRAAPEDEGAELETAPPGPVEAPAPEPSGLPPMPASSLPGAAPVPEPPPAERAVEAPAGVAVAAATPALALPEAPAAPVETETSSGPATETAGTVPVAVAEATVPPAPEAAGPRLKLSQRVMLHLYRQGHLAEGEVAPIGFTQSGMSDALGVAQSPLSSVLRRLTVAGLVVQDTRHVRGQPRRLRVYRLTPLGESVARDLYLHPHSGGTATDPVP